MHEAAGQGQVLKKMTCEASLGGQISKIKVPTSNFKRQVGRWTGGADAVGVVPMVGIDLRWDSEFDAEDCAALPYGALACESCALLE